VETQKAMKTNYIDMLIREASENMRASWRIVSQTIRNYLFLNAVLLATVGISVSGTSNIDKTVIVSIVAPLPSLDFVDLAFILRLRHFK
jgi:hypothetical protein